jgi:hypothetical protein
MEEPVRHRKRVVSRVLGGLVAAGALAALGASSASAVIVQLPGGKTLSYMPLKSAVATVTPFDVLFKNLDYSGGPVMPSNTNYAVYWRPSSGPAYPADYQPGLDRYFEDLAHDSGGNQNVDSVAVQYNDASGQLAQYDSHFAGALVDTHPYPANGCTRAAICLTDAQIQAELKSFVVANGLPYDLMHEYFLITPPGVESCFETAGNICSAASKAPYYCAYHGNIPLGEGQIIYANDPYVTEVLGCDDGNHPNGTTSDGALQGGLSHEHVESITDPEPNNAWTDWGAETGEIGDKCAATNGAKLGTAPNEASYNQVVNGHLYWYQEEWSNQLHQCRQRFSFSGEKPTATFTSTAAGGNEVSFDASASSASGGVSRYAWQFNDGPGQTKTSETAKPTITHSFPAGGQYLVALTVFAADGASIGTAKKVIAGTPPLPAVTKITPKRGPAAGGTSVTITGKNLSEATDVSFGSLPAASFTVNSATSITAVSPAQSAETVDVTVTAPGGTSAASIVDRFKFGPPTITAVAPNNGPAAGGTSVTVTGTGFATGTTATSFKFALTAAASVNCSSQTECTVVSPAHKAGLVDVRATVGNVLSPKTAGDRFTFH